MSTIYHYCDIRSFLSIIQSKKIWVSAAHNLNDSGEIFWFRNKLEKHLNRYKNQTNIKNIKDFYTLMRANNLVPYIASFSKNGDQLSQWRAYADDGFGVAIGFNRESFNLKNDIPYMHVNLEHTMGIHDIYYDDSVQEKAANEIALNVTRDFGSEEEKSQIFLTQILSMLRFCYIFKNSAFAEEGEVRITHTPSIMKDDEDRTEIMGQPLSEIKYRVSGQRITSYFEFSLRDRSRNVLIDKIIVGPKSQISRFDLELLLSENQFFNIECANSSASYR